MSGTPRPAGQRADSSRSRRLWGGQPSGSGFTSIVGGDDWMGGSGGGGSAPVLRGGREELAGSGGRLRCGPIAPTRLLRQTHSSHSALHTSPLRDTTRRSSRRAQRGRGARGRLLGCPTVGGSAAHNFGQHPLGLTIRAALTRLSQPAQRDLVTRGVAGGAQNSPLDALARNRSSVSSEGDLGAPALGMARPPGV